MRIELEPEGSGCLLRFTDVLFFEGERTRTEITNSVLGGWHHFLDSLEAALDGRSFDFSAPEFDYSKVEVQGRE